MACTGGDYVDQYREVLKYHVLDPCIGECQHIIIFLTVKRKTAWEWSFPHLAYIVSPILTFSVTGCSVMSSTGGIPALVELELQRGTLAV